MDASLAKTFKTSRGYNYRYYFAPAQGSKPTLLFSHGFPSTAESWHKQAAFFKSKGYGIVVPDLLGYYGTDIPTDVEAYRLKSMVGDLVEILDHEKLNENVVAIGHDWGSSLTSRIANWRHEDKRFIAFGFLAVSYLPPTPDFDIEKFNAASKEKWGYERFGYQLFFATDGTSKIIKDHVDSFISLLYAKNTDLWKTDLAPLGTYKQWLLNDKKTEVEDWAKDEKEFNLHIDHVKANGAEGGLNWYKTREFNQKDEKDLPKEHYEISKPTFFGAALKDAVCIAPEFKEIHSQFCPKATIVDFDTGHWVHNAQPDKVNDELLKWIEGL